MYEQLVTCVDEIIRTMTSTAIIFISFQFMYIIKTKNTITVISRSSKRLINLSSKLTQYTVVVRHARIEVVVSWYFDMK